MYIAPPPDLITKRAITTNDYGAGTGTPRKCVAMSIVAQIAIPITAASLTDE